MTREVTVRLSAEVQNYISGMMEAERATKQMGDSAQQAQQTAEQQAQTTGRALVAFGTGVTGAMGAASAAATQWDSDWTDVARRTDASAAELDGLEESLRGIARELPTTHSEVAAVAASAAQLGVASGDVEEFTRVMIAMGTATNMTAEEAATSMQRFANVMDTPVDEMSNLGSAVVDLGNNSATTESEIMTMAQRLAAAGAQVGMTEGDLLGMSAALSSVGVEAQAGGTALSRVMYDIDGAVAEGSESLEGFADVAGMSADEFSRLWEEDAAMGIEAFVSGLGRIDDEGGNAQQALQELGITEVRTTAALLSMSQAGDQLSESLARGNEAYAEGTAMADEAGQVYETAASRFLAAWAQIQDAAIDAGQYIVPVLVTIAEAVGTAASLFSALPGPVQAAVVGIAGLAGVLSLAGGALLLAIPRIHATATAMRAMASRSTLASTGLAAFSTQGSRTRGVMRNLSRAAGGLATAFIALEVLKAFGDDAAAAIGSAQEMSAAIQDLGESGAAAGAQLEELTSYDGGWWYGEIDGLAQAVDHMNQNMVGSAVWGFFDAIGVGNEQTVAAREALEQYDAALAGLAQEGDIDALVDGFQYITDAMQDAEWASFEDMLGELPQLESALNEAGVSMESFVSAARAGDIEWLADAMGISADEAEHLANELEGVEAADPDLSPTAEAAGNLADELSGAAESIDTLLEGMRALGLVERDAHMAMLDYTDSVTDLWDALSEGNVSYSEFNDGLAGIADSGIEAARGMALTGESAEDVAGQLSGTHEDVLALAEGFLGAGEEADELAALMMGLDPSIDFEVDGWELEVAEELLGVVGEEADDLNGKRIEIETEVLGEDAYDRVRQKIEDTPSHTLAELEVAAETGTAEAVLYELTEGSYETLLEITGDETLAQRALEALENGEYTAVASILGDDELFQELMLGLLEQEWTSEVGLEVDAYDAEMRLRSFESTHWETTVYVEGNAENANALMAAFVAEDYNTVIQYIGDESAAQEAMSAFLAGDYETVAEILANDDQARSTIGSFTSTQWQTTIEAIAQTLAAEGDLNTTARDRTSTATASASTGGAEADLNHTARNRTTTITATFGGLVDQGGFGSGAGSPFINRAHGGRAGTGMGLPAFASGGRLPATGLGTDQILGVNRAGQPTAWVDDREWIINRKSSDRYDGLLQAINNDDPYGIKRYAAQLSGYAAGGRTGYQGQVREFSQPAAPRVTVQAPAGSGASRNTTVNNYTYYPIPEKTSRSQQRGAALAGMGFDPDEMGG